MLPLIPIPNGGALHLAAWHRLRSRGVHADMPQPVADPTEGADLFYVKGRDWYHKRRIFCWRSCVICGGLAIAASIVPVLIWWIDERTTPEFGHEPPMLPPTPPSPLPYGPPVAVAG